MKQAVPVLVLMAVLGIAAPASADDLNAHLLSLSAAEQTAALAKIVGQSCVGVRAFYDGIGTSGFTKDKAYWSVSCKNDMDYMVEIRPDGRSGALQCMTAQGVGAGKCFTKF